MLPPDPPMPGTVPTRPDAVPGLPPTVFPRLSAADTATALRIETWREDQPLPPGVRRADLTRLLTAVQPSTCPADAEARDRLAGRVLAHGAGPGWPYCDPEALHALLVAQFAPWPAWALAHAVAAWSRAWRERRAPNPAEVLDHLPRTAHRLKAMAARARRALEAGARERAEPLPVAERQALARDLAARLRAEPSRRPGAGREATGA